MNRWPWSRKHAPDRDALATARAQLAAGRDDVDDLRNAATGARRRLADAIGREQSEIRRNHLGELMHSALATRKGQHP